MITFAHALSVGRPRYESGTTPESSEQMTDFLMIIELMLRHCNGVSKVQNLYNSLPSHLIEDYHQFLYTNATISPYDKNNVIKDNQLPSQFPS